MSAIDDRATWHSRAQALKPRTQAFIDGRYRDADSGETFECVNPATGALLARVASCGAADVDAAVASARRAFEAGHWSRMAPAARKRVLRRFAELLMQHRDELALTETLDMGKPIADSLAVDIPAAARCIEWYAEAIDKVYDEVAPTAHQTVALVTREPVGVVGAIVPWNFPLLMASWKLGPALATGNSVVLKPSEKSPLTALRVAGLAIEAGLPEGVLNVVPGFGHTAGEPLALHMDVDCIAFTGSTRIGRRMLEYSGRSNMKRVWLECGGKSPNIVLADAPDLERAAQAAALGIFFNQGEMCSAASRLLAQESILEPLVERIVEIGRGMAPGDPLDPATRVGALVDRAQLDTVMGYIEAGRGEGARIRLGGERVLEETGGCFVEPTVFDRVRGDMKIAREEIFGPVLSVIGFRDEAQALALANDTMYGLVSAVWSRDIGTAHRVAKSLRAGTVYVNCYDADDITVPFGGFKQSGNGRDKSLHALDKYTELKTTWIDLGT
ncbi:MAG: aldehyde dehydrogenase [Steroidobacteraceae bacterium]|jgi:4-guanidinobutyraldehyde dehydrogenase/NAD-dependent aldehyde dehydrogenase|nr:aldehyde dehydrogenase [Steroidobacteraceae bacterium]